MLLKIDAAIGAPVHRARTSEALGRLLIARPRGDHQRAHTLLVHALREYERLGMQRSAANLKLSGLASPPAARPEGLTSREIEVLRLIAGGKTNHEIAESFVLSERTVERHITNAYAKIRARGKADATAFVFRHGLVDSTRLG